MYYILFISVLRPHSVIPFPYTTLFRSHRSEVRTELGRALEEPEQRILRVLQLLHVRQEAACLDGVQELPRRLLPPLRSEDHTSEIQSRLHLVCRLLLENKNDVIL